MPTYQYACTECNHRFEEVQAFTDASLSECPQCGGHLRKVYGSVGVVFKGSGFYRTDSRSDGGSHKSSGLSAENGPSKSGDGAAGSSDGGRKSGTPAAAAASGSGSGSSNGSSSTSGSSSSSSTAKAAAS